MNTKCIAVIRKVYHRDDNSFSREVVLYEAPKDIETAIQKLTEIGGKITEAPYLFICKIPVQANVAKWADESGIDWTDGYYKRLLA